MDRSGYCGVIRAATSHRETLNWRSPSSYVFVTNADNGSDVWTAILLWHDIP